MKKIYKKGQIALYISFIILAIILVLLGAVFGPMGALFTVEMFAAGEEILIMANETANNISDPNIRAALTGTLTAATEATQMNVDVNAGLFQYSWILIIALAGLVIFLNTRRLVEFGGGGFI